MISSRSKDPYPIDNRERKKHNRIRLITRLFVSVGRVDIARFTVRNHGNSLTELTYYF